MKHLYFVRHGQSQANVDRIFAGQSNTPLTALGRHQAEVAAQEIKDLGIDHMISSPLSRTHETARIIAAVIAYPEEKIEISNLLLERSYGSATGLSWDTDLDGFIDVETMDLVAERARLAYEHILSLPYEEILVVGHGTFWQKLYMTIHPGSVVTDADEPANAEVSKLL